jgi:hypothetical protein
MLLYGLEECRRYTEVADVSTKKGKLWTSIDFHRAACSLEYNDSVSPKDCSIDFFRSHCVGNGSGRCEKVQKRCRSLYSSGLSIYRMTRPHWPLRHRTDSGPGLSGFPILPLREYPAHTKVRDRESKCKSRRTKESKKERLSTSETDSASTWMLPKKKQN